ncbi:N-acetyltransferase [filamentous cyanobacterium LEGE 11480]|uniref:N-acetyltransferase n=2 Tax=Romeriopsis TaxID=2992131 RepID=A0A928VLI6_9CYAN|nr:N-acetyltransferase [Romeriopsis navalis LEGE 11480]
MTIRNAVLTDLPRIVEIYNAAVPSRQATADTEPVTIKSRVPWFESHQPQKRPLWVLTKRERILGWIGLQDFYGRPAYCATCEFSLYIAPEVQHQGLGYALLSQMMHDCPDWGVKTLLGFIFEHNQPSLKLCRKLGFDQWGLLPGIAELDDQTRDLVIMGRRLV